MKLRTFSGNINLLKQLIFCVHTGIKPIFLWIMTSMWNMRLWCLFLTPADIFEQKEENARLYEALASLPEKQRNRITSHFLLGMSLSDIAKSEGTGVSSVHEGIQRGLRRLKKNLEKMNTDPENYHQK